MCGYCTTTYPVEAYSGDLHAKTINFKTPWWTFFGLGIAVVLITAAIYSSVSSHKDSQAFKITPQEGAYFTFAIIDDAYKKTPYSFGRIEKVKDDEIVVRFSKYAYSQKNMAIKSVQNSKDKSEDSLDSDIVTLTKEKFKEINLVSPVY
ncbi:MAG: hypothetical protein LN568_06485 [Rickettsia endosymbiont of Pseudomimeciton antennatum]|nr:hypothetical protein [Rickettsia endosymbiont of Pseudomimeciton antennatum]